MSTPDPITRLNAALEGRYRVERQLGEGGMATVYLADDLRHERKVALKVLKPELAAVVGAGRFLAEIKTTANLQHPHILPLFDSGEADGFLFYVMPYVEGESLRQRLDREHQLPVDEAVRIATKVAGALQAAHERGVIHRDIKPANILLSKGEPLVSDFGIALALTAGGAGRLTETGLSLGTPHYMSPEQATGDLSVGAATDVYALGCVLYEMLVGEPPYTGGTPQAVLGKIVTSEADPVRKHRRSVPPNVDAAIRKALEKVPADRFNRAVSFAEGLADPGFRLEKSWVGPRVEGSLGLWRTVSFALAVVAGGLALAFGWAVSRPDTPRPVVWSEIEHSIGQDLLVSDRYHPLVALSPDGQEVVYVGVAPGGGVQLWRRSLDQPAAVPLPGTQGAAGPSFSPDGRSIAFVREGDIFTLSLDGTLPALLVADAGQPYNFFAVWGADGMVYFTDRGLAIRRVPGTGGDPELIYVPQDPWAAGVATDVLPDERGVLITRTNPDATRAELAIVDPRSGDAHGISEGFNARYSPSGHLVFQDFDDPGTLFAMPIDLEHVEGTGPARPIVDGVFTPPGSPPGVWALARNGDLIYMTSAAVDSGRELVWVDRSGRTEAVKLDPDLRRPLTLALSPDDRRVALSIGDGVSSASIWVKELPDGPTTKLTDDSEVSRRPVWSPDGSSIYFVGAGPDPSTTSIGIRSVASDGSSAGRTEPELTLDGTELLEAAFARDGQHRIVFRVGDATQGRANLGLVDLETGEVDDSLLASDFNEVAVAVSADGRWLAYVSDPAGHPDVFVRPFPDVSAGQRQVSTNGGSEPVWGHRGPYLFYRELESGAMIMATYVTEPTFEVVNRERLFDASKFVVAERSLYRSYDLTSDDQRFLMMRDVALEGEGRPRLVLVQGFAEDLKRLTPAN